MHSGYAYLVVSGEGDVERISEKLPVRPTMAWSHGDPHPQRGEGHTRRGTVWILDSPLPKSEALPLERHVETLLAFMEEHRAALAALRSRYDMRIQCTTEFGRPITGFNLTAALLRRLLDCGISSIDFDLYPDDDQVTGDFYAPTRST